MESDQQLMELFDAATNDLRPPIEEIYQQSVSRGKRLRRRRDARVLLGTASVLAVSVGAVLTLPHLGSTAMVTAAASTSPSEQATASAGATATSSAVPTASVSTAPTLGATEAATAPASLVPLTTKTGTQILESLLPAGSRIVGPMPDPYTLVDVEYTDGHGTSELTVGTQSVATFRGLTTCAGWLGGTNEGTPPAGALKPTCSVENLPGGATEIIVITGVDTYGFYDIETTLVPTTGFTVTVTTSNGLPLGATVDVTRAVPPLSVAQTQAIAADPQWQAQ